MARYVGRVLAVFLVLLPGAVFADQAVNIRQGRHGDMGRLVFDFAAAESFQSRQAGGLLTIQFTPATPIATIALHIPGFASMQGGAGIVRLQLADGAAPSVYRLGNRIVVDARLRRPEFHAAAKPPKTLPVAAVPPALAAAPAGNVPANIHLAALTMPAPAPQTALPQAALPQAMAAISLAPVPPAMPAPPGPTPDVSAPDVSTPATISFATQPGAASFRRAGLALIVFDTPEVPDLTALQSSPGFAGATLVSLQNAQVISIPLPQTEALAVTPVSGGWQVAAIPATQPAPPPLQASVSVVNFPMHSANKSIIVSDPLTGGDLLVGTVTQPGDAADYSESGPGYAVLPAWLGVAVIPQADDLGLNAALNGFQLVSDAPDGLKLGKLPPPAINVATSASFGQSLNLPRGSTADLWKRLVADQLAAATLPPLGRLNAQITLAQDMLALGMGAEATGVLNTAVLENPAAQDNGQIAEMHAVANVLSHRSLPADFTAPGIAASPDLAFWAAAGLLDSGQTRRAIPGLIAGLPLFQTYPDALRNTVTAEIAETLADNGSLQAAQQWVNSDPGNALLALARAKILEDQGNAKTAFTAYQSLARGEDGRVSAIANARLVELRLAAGQMTAAQAADALDAQLFDWRAAQHERHMRLRIAQLRATAGQWPQAFAMLQSARQLFPGHRDEINAARAAMFLNMLGSNAFTQLSPIEAVAVLQQNQDLIQRLGAGTQVIDLLAQRLDELDLPGAAAPMLSQLIQTIPPGAAQASLGATLAQVDLDAGSPVAARADLSQTQADNLPPDLAARRDTLAAKAQAQAGDAIAPASTFAPAAADPTVAPANSQSLDSQAQIAEQAGQWQQAQQALGALVSQSVPATGPIGPNPENLLLRLATAASHNNDSATLAALSSQYSSRVGADAAGQMFQTLTAPPLTGDQGLNQALHEIAQLQALPAMLNAVAATAGASKTQTFSAAAPH